MSSSRPILALKPKEPLQSGFSRLLGEFESELHRLTHISARNQPTLLHDTRVLIKRLRALLWFVQPALAHAIRTESKRRLRHAAELLAGSRDMAVARETLQTLARQISGRDDDLKLLSKIRRTLHSSASPHVPALVRRALSKVTASLSPLHRQAGTVRSWPLPSDRVTKAAHQLHHARKKAKHAANSTLHHKWRKKTKRLLYLVELLHPQPDKRTARLIHRLDRLQNTLGQSHDCAITRLHLPRKATHIRRLLRQREKYFQARAARQARHLKRLD